MDLDVVFVPIAPGKIGITRRCKHEMIPQWCSLCLGIRETPEPGMARTFGSCAACQMTIYPGDLITRWIRNQRKYVGECCSGN